MVFLTQHFVDPVLHHNSWAGINDRRQMVSSQPYPNPLWYERE